MEQEAAPIVADIEGDVPLTVEAELDPSHVETPAEPPETSMADAIKKELDDRAKSDEFFQSKKEEPKDALKEATPKDEAKRDDKPLDEIYRIPEGMTGQHRAAFKRLSDHALGLNEKFTAVETQYREAMDTLTEYHQIIQETQASPDQVDAMFGYIEMVNKGDLENAFRILETERNELARRLGKPAPGVDLLEGFDDLKADVQNMQMTPERAAEIARYRRQQSEQQAHAQRQGQEQAQQQAFEQARDTAMNEIAEWMQGLKANDIDFAAKDKLLAPKIGEILTDLDPKHWLRQLRLYYDSLQVQQPRPVREAQPLRPGSGGGGKAAPRSMLEAINSGLGYDQAS